MKQIGAAKFKEQCLSLLDSVDAEGLIITKHGKPVARLLPMRPIPSYLIGCLKSKVRVKGDILSTGIKWNAES
jgi:prevent-host-death family protein